MTALPDRGRRSWGATLTLRCLGLTWACGIAMAGPSVAPTTPPPSVPAAPFQFAPTPFALPVANATLDRQLTSLLRGFRSIQRSEVVLSGEAGHDLSAQIVVQLRAGATLDEATLQSLMQLILSAVPGLAPERLNIASGDGRMLVAQGRIPPPLDTPGAWPVPPHLIAVFVGAVLLIALALTLASRARRRGADEVLDRLILRHERQLVRLLRDERPEVGGLVVSLAGPGAARRLERRLRVQQVPVKRPGFAADPRAARAVVNDLHERLGAGR